MKDYRIAKAKTWMRLWAIEAWAEQHGEWGSIGRSSLQKFETIDEAKAAIDKLRENDEAQAAATLAWDAMPDIVEY